MITVIGLDGSPLSRAAAQAVAGATLLVGGRRHLAAVGVAGDEASSAPLADLDPAVIAAGARATSPPLNGTDSDAVSSADGPGLAPVTATRPQVVVMGPLRPALDALAAHDGEAVVLASGDPGFFGIVRALRERGLGCEVLPATSSVALAFARAGLPWDDAVVVSAHGRGLRAAVNVCRAYPKVAVLTGPGQGPAEIGAALAGWPRRLLVAEDLGAPGERLTECTPAAATQREWSDPNVVLSLGALVPGSLDRPPAPPAPALGRSPASPAPTPEAPASASTVSAPPAPDPPIIPPAPPPEGGEFVINRLVSLGRHQSVDHEAGGGPTSLLGHTRPRSESPGPSGPADQSVIMGLLGSGPQQSHDHEEGGRPSGLRGLENHTSPSGPGSSAPGPGWCWPLGSGIGDEGWALGEEAFEHRDSMVTKPEVRALALARLGPGPGLLVWDVGAGSGSVAVECARFGAAVIAVERDPAQCARVTANAWRYRAEVRVVAGVAPDALDGLPDPDAVFVGGGGLPVISAVAARRPARVVVALAAVQRAGQATEVLDDAGYRVDGTLLQASHLTPLPDGAHRLAAANPVFLLSATLPQPSSHHDRGVPCGSE